MVAGYGDVGKGSAQSLRGFGCRVIITVTSDHCNLSSKHDIGGPLDSVNKGLPAAVEVVELGLGHGVVDIDGGDLQGLLGEHLVQVMHASGSLLRQTLDSLEVLRELLVDEVGEITPIVQDHVQGLAIGADEGLLDAPDVLLV